MDHPEGACQRRVKIPQKCQSKIPHFYGSGDQPGSVIICKRDAAPLLPFLI